MKGVPSLLYVYSNKKDIKLPKKKGQVKSEYLSLTLESEFYLNKLLNGYKNPLYSLINLSGYASMTKYFSKSLAISSSWYKNPIHEYTQLRLGLWLTELSRSLDLSWRAIEKYKPTEIFTANITDYEGSSVIDGSLISAGFLLNSKIRNIKIKKFKRRHFYVPFFRIHGFLLMIINKIVLFASLNRVDLKHHSVLFIAPPSKLVQMKSLAESFKKNNIDVLYLTYDLTLKQRTLMSSFKTKYLEKAQLKQSNYKNFAKSQLKKVNSEAEWRNFSHPKFNNSRIIMDFIKQKIKKIIKDEMWDILIDIARAEHVMNVIKPELVVTLTDPDTKCLPYVNKANEHGIKTVCIQHGATFDSIPQLNPRSSYFTVWSDFAKNWLVLNNKLDTSSSLSSKVLIGQSPFHKNINTKLAKKYYGQIKILLLSTQHFFERELTLYYLKKLFSSLEQTHENIELTIRLHPHQNPTDFDALIINGVTKSSLDKNPNLEVSLKETDVVIFENTTAGLDAMLSGKPTIFFNPYTGGDFFELKKKRISHSILDGKTIVNEVDYFFKNKHLWQIYAFNGRAFAKKYLGVGQGKNKIVMQIKKLLIR